MSSAAKEISREENAPTPGVDDTPYIHFALDQLTRDEEVRGSRAYPGQRLSGGGRPKSYEILGLHDPIPTPSGPDEWHTRAEELHNIAAGGLFGAHDYERFDEPLPIPPRSPRRSSAQPPTQRMYCAKQPCRFPLTQANPSQNHLYLSSSYLSILRPTPSSNR